jgi:hypothetical protein
MKYLAVALLAFEIQVLAQSENCRSYTYRKEASDLTDAEWGVYVDTIKQAVDRGIWREAANFHNNLADDIHWNSIFLPW